MQVLLNKTFKDRNAYRQDYGVLATENIILENKLAQLQSGPDLQAKCQDLDSNLDELQARCLDLETSLARSKSLRVDEDSERKALFTEARQAKSELEDFKNKNAKVDKKRRVALQTTVYELEKEVRARNDKINVMETTVDELGKEVRARNDKTNVMEAALGAQKTMYEDQIAKQSQQIKQLKLQQLGHEESRLNTAALENETRELKISLESKRATISEHQSRIVGLEETIKAEEAFRKDTELTSLENTGNQASQDLQLQALTAANQTRIAELERLLGAKDAEYQSRELENTRNQLTEIARLQGLLAWTNAEQATLREQHRTESQNLERNCQDLLKARDAELERSNAHSLLERESQRLKIQSLQDALDSKNNAMDVDTVTTHAENVADHVCDHSKCIDQDNFRAGQISSLEALLMGSNLKVRRLQTEANEQGMKMEGLLWELRDQKAATTRLQQSVNTSEHNWSQLRASLQLGEEHDFATIERTIRQWQSNSASQPHQCDHSVCDRRALANSNEISELQHTVLSRKAKIEDQERKMSSLKADTQKVCRKANLAVKAANDKLQEKEKALEEEIRKRSQSTNRQVG